MRERLNKIVKNKIVKLGDFQAKAALIPEFSEKKTVISQEFLRDKLFVNIKNKIFRGNS